MYNAAKISSLKKISDILQLSPMLFFCSYASITVGELQVLRRQLHSSSCSASVFKNALVSIALSQAGIKVSKNFLRGQILTIYGEDVIAISKTIELFSKKDSRFSVLGVVSSQKVEDNSVVKLLSSFSSLEGVYASFLGVLQAPASNLCRVVQAPPTGVVRVLHGFCSK